ncbi:site-2 protease family protein [Singulisphaera sp. PoT]|uniref:site-2 protease family protein n=1 Tax=Singulisphaera sp. PoT TaxID=3411797 RepID=UPI003BF501A9
MWSPISLGRWFGIEIRVHISLAVFAFLALLGAVVTTTPHLGYTASWIVLLLAALLVHETGHALASYWTGAEPEDVRLWPLGNMVSPSATARPNDAAVVALAGPAANLLVVLISASVLMFFHTQFAWNPFGHEKDLGAPRITGTTDLVPFGRPLWWLGWFGYINYLLCIANLIPAMPFDTGRILRGHLATVAVTQPKDGMLGPYVARTCAVILAIVGVIRLVLPRQDGLTLIFLAILIELIARSEARMLEDGGFYDDGVFGYDFSEGYTSLEGSAAKVRPYRESAIKRWRRRRSDVRKQRRLAREAADERRMDEILDKLYREGRSALTDEEQRFLVRVSVKYRNKPKAGE